MTLGPTSQEEYEAKSRNCRGQGILLGLALVGGATAVGLSLMKPNESPVSGRMAPIPVIEEDSGRNGLAVVPEEIDYNKIPVLADDSSLSVGDRAVVPDWKWVNVINEDPVEQVFSNGYSELNKGDNCGVETGGIIEILDFPNATNAIVKYQSPGIPRGTPCPSGVVFEIDTKEFAGLTGAFTNKMNSVRDLRKNISDIFAGNTRNRIKRNGSTSLASILKSRFAHISRIRFFKSNVSRIPIFSFKYFMSGTALPIRYIISK